MRVLNISGNLAAAKLQHNRIYKIFDKEENENHTPMELVIFDDTAVLNGDKLYF